MGNKFKVGTISNMINQTNKKMKKVKKEEPKEETLKPEFEVTEDESIPKTEVKIEKVKSNKKKRKISETNSIPKEEEAVEQSITEDDQEKTNKKQKVKKNVTSTKVEEDNQKKELDQAMLEKFKRTLFVGNLPANFPLKSLKNLLKEFGKVKSIRVRSLAPAKISLSKKTAFLSKQINPNKKNVNAYIVFDQPEAVDKALKINGTEFENHIIQVDRVDPNPSYDSSLSVFIGNLSFKATEDEIRNFFKDCGDIKNVRLIRDGKTGIGKGFGYVNFISKDSVVLALEKDGQSLNNREIRVKANNYMSKNQIENLNKKRKKIFPKNPNTNGQEKAKVVKEKGGKLEKAKTTFSGEKASKKKLTKKSIKNKLKSNKIKKQGKKIAEILSK